MGGASLGATLVVEDDASLRSAIVDALAGRHGGLRACGSVAAVRDVIESGWRPDLVILDVVLPDGDAFAVLDALGGAPAPTTVAISGEAVPDQSFALSRRGVCAYVSKPFVMTTLDAALERAVATPPELEPIVRQVVGKRELREVEAELRAVMVAEAMSRSGGSRSGAARLLGISRQLLQHALRRKR